MRQTNDDEAKRTIGIVGTGTGVVVVVLELEFAVDSMMGSTISTRNEDTD